MLLVGLESRAEAAKAVLPLAIPGGTTLLVASAGAAAMTSSMALVRTTLASRDAADGLARRLVDAGLAACVHVQQLHSTYRWMGKVESQAEWLVEARALESRAAAVREAMLEGHPYELPLVETLMASGISKEYLDWARQP